MALINIQERWSGREGSIEQANVVGAQKGIGSRAFTVLFDAPPSSPVLAIDAAGIPNIVNAYPNYTWISCRRKRAVPLGPLLYDVVCEYSGNDSPLMAAAQISWQEASGSDLVDYDADGDALVNSVGEPYQTQKDVADPVRVYIRNEATYPASTMFAYWNALNSDTVLGIWPEGTARMLPITATRQDDGTDYYYVTTYRVQFRKDGWKARIPNKGRRYRAVAGGKLLRVRDLLGIEEALLRANGTLLNGTGTEEPAGEKTVWLTPPIYPKVPFAPLGIW